MLPWWPVIQQILQERRPLINRTVNSRTQSQTSCWDELNDTIVWGTFLFLAFSKILASCKPVKEKMSKDDYKVGKLISKFLEPFHKCVEHNINVICSNVHKLFWRFSLLQDIHLQPFATMLTTWSQKSVALFSFAICSFVLFKNKVSFTHVLNKIIFTVFVKRIILRTVHSFLHTHENPG